MFLHSFDILMIPQIARMSEEEKAFIDLISALLTANSILEKIQAFMNIACSKQSDAFIALINQALTERDTALEKYREAKRR